MAKSARKTQSCGLPATEECVPVSKGKTATRTASQAANRSLCERCLWDCVQPYGITVACPHYQDRGAEQERQARSGQLSFGFSGSQAPTGSSTRRTAEAGQAR